MLLKTLSTKCRPFCLDLNVVHKSSKLKFYEVLSRWYIRELKTWLTHIFHALTLTSVYRWWVICLGWINCLRNNKNTGSSRLWWTVRKTLTALGQIGCTSRTLWTTANSNNNNDYYCWRHVSKSKLLMTLMSIYSIYIYIYLCIMVISIKKTAEKEAWHIHMN